MEWRVRNRAFADVVVGQKGYAPAHRNMTGVATPTPVLTFRSTGDELHAWATRGRRSIHRPWSPTVLGLVLDDDTDWEEGVELVTESYRFAHPRNRDATWIMTSYGPGVRNLVCWA